MGVKLAPILEKEIVSLKTLSGRSFAVDANNLLYQFLALIRGVDGSPLTDRHGNITSHLIGLAFRTTRLVSDYSMRLFFVFDGKPHPLKQRALEERRRVKAEASKAWREALAAGDLAKAYSKAVMTSRLSRDLIVEAKKLLSILGFPWMDAPGEAEAQTAHICRRGDVWAANSRDYDSILFAAPRLVRYITVSGAEFLPSKGIFRPLKPEFIDLEVLLKKLGITHPQLIDLAIILGTDFNAGVKGIGPKTALKLIRQYGAIENLPDDIRSRVSIQYPVVRQIFSKPDVTDEYELRYGNTDEEALLQYLCREKGFAEKRVQTLIRRMRRIDLKSKQTGLTKWT